jgi:chromosome segregation ATPase
MSVNPYIKKGLKTGDRITKYYLDDIETCLSDSVNTINTNDANLTSIKTEITTARNGEIDLNSRLGNIDNKIGNNTNLNTTDKSNLVNAVNENTNDIDNIKVTIDNNTTSINELTTKQTETIRDLALGSFSQTINLEGLTIGNLVLSRSQVILGNIILA